MSHSHHEQHGENAVCEHGASGYCYKCAEEEFTPRRDLVLIGFSLVLFITGMVFRTVLHDTPYSLGEYGVFLTAYLLCGRGVLWTAIRNILHGEVFDENFLMSIATLGAIAIHEIPEAAGVMLFFRVGEFFEALSVNRSRRSVRALMDIRPDSANLKREDGIRKVHPEDVAIGDEIIVKPGERIPLDGEILEGSALVDTSALTGESVPGSFGAGDAVLAGMISKTGSLTIKVTKKFGESSISRILEMVETATARKANTEKFITRFARYYTPVVVVAALAVALMPPLLIRGATFSGWIYRALVLLVISCPCALVISIPLGYFGGVGGASRKGILVKGANCLDVITKVKIAVFDKTGTLTRGVFKVQDAVPSNGYEKSALLRLAAQAEAQSNHPIAHSIREAYHEAYHPPVDLSSVREYREIPGLGVRAEVNGTVLLAGNDKLLHREGVAHEENVCSIEGTVVHIAENHRYAGFIVIADEIKEDAQKAVRSLKKLGVEKVVMLTGDSDAAAASVARKIGVDFYLSGLLPEDKVAAIEKLEREEGGKGTIAFVGDGINDAPVIARADVGVAMGGLGSDAAIETADVVIMTDNPSKLAQAIDVARKTRRIVWQNIGMAMGVKGIFVVLGVIGFATIWEAVFADVGVALLAILNATRTMRS